MTPDPSDTPQASNAGDAGEPVIRLVDVYKAFGRLKVLRGVNIEFHQGKTTVVIGPSGCGKSVMLKHIVGLLRPDAGEVWYQQHRVDRMREANLVEVRTDFGYLFQLGALFDSMTVQQNVCFPLEEHTDMSRQQQCDRCTQVLGLVGMDRTQNKRPAELSGGQRKRIALARAIALLPKVILYDEPTTGLDPIRSDTINELILKLQHELHATSIVVTHDMTSAYKIADRIVMLYDGHIIADGDPDDIRRSENPIVRAFVEGRSDMHQIDGLEASLDG